MKNIQKVTLDRATMKNGDTLVLPCTVNYYLIETEEDAKEAVQNLLPIVSNPKEKIAIDVETRGFDPRLHDILLLQIGIKDNVQYIFDIRKISLDIVKPLLETDCWKIGHNLKFDAKFIKYKAKANLRKFFDTFLAEMVIRGGSHFDGFGRISYALDAVILRRLGLEMKIIPNSSSFSTIDEREYTASAKKIMQKSFLEMGATEPFSEAQLAYAAQDVSSETIFKVANLQEQDLKKPGKNTLHDPSINSVVDPEIKENYLQMFPPLLRLWETAWLEFKFLEVVIDLELGGIGFSLEDHKKVVQNITQDYKAYRAEFLKLLAPKAKQKTLFGGAGINPDSPTQILKSLNELGLGLEDTNSDTLDAKLRSLESKTAEYKILECLINYRAMSKLVSSYGEKLAEHLHPVSKRIHFEIKQILDTGRISNLNPNLQQMPKKIDWKKTGDPEKDAIIDQRPGLRECFQARPGYRFIIFDYSQQELRVAASISLDHKMIQAFKEGKELHSYSATLMYGGTYEEFVKKVKAKDGLAVQQRGTAKTVSFGALYGSGAPNLARTLHIDLDKAKEILTRFWAAYPALENAMKRYGSIANAVGYSNTVLGRRRYYTDIIQKIKWIIAEENPDVIQRKVDELGMRWFTNKYGFVTFENIEHAKQSIIKKYQGDISRQAANHHIQGTSADMTKLAAINIRKDFLDKGMDARIVGLVHDEIIVECLLEEVEEGEAIVGNRMKEALNFFCPNVVAEADGKHSVNWKKD